MNKDSGVPWTSKMPTGWKTCKYKYFTSNGMGETILREELKDEGIPVYSATQDDVCFGFVENSRVILHKGDFIIPARGNSIGCISLVKEEVATCTQTTIYSKLIGLPVVNKYLFYCALGLKDVWFKFDQTAIPQITVSQVDNNIVPLPESEKKQQAIADYLDKGCARIDDIVEKQRNIIEKLKEYKKSVITEAVTKGLNPNVTMKDSGIEWIGDIPEHWKAGKVFYYLDSMGSGTTPTGDDYYTEQGINWLNTGDLTDYYITEIPKKITPQAIQQFSALKIHKADSIVIAMYGATIGKLGILTEDTTTNQACCVMTPTKDLYNKFLFYCLYAGKDYMLYLSFGSGQPNINQNILRHFVIPHVPTEEQKFIVGYLDQKCAEIDSVIEKREKMIDLLTEYKKSLIYECVTGKKEVA